MVLKSPDYFCELLYIHQIYKKRTRIHDKSFQFSLGVYDDFISLIFETE